MRIEIKPCPFCGGDDVERIGFDALFKERPHIKCHGCGADVYDVPNVNPIWHKHDSMTQTWNTRAERTCEYVIEDNMNETEGMGEVWIECSACHCKFDYFADDWLMKMSYCPNCGARVEVES